MGLLRNLWPVYTNRGKALVIGGMPVGGHGTVTWPGGSQTSGITSVPHGITDKDGNPAAPSVAVACAVAAGFDACEIAVSGFDGRFVYVQGSFETVTPTAGSTQGFFWIALVS